jgi:hypothetical protein
LQKLVQRWSKTFGFATMCPEAMGVNVTATMKEIGIQLEWPPKRWAHQVAMGAELL